MPPNNVEIVYGTKGTFNESIISDYFIPKVLVDLEKPKAVATFELDQEKINVYFNKFFKLS